MATLNEKLATLVEKYTACDVRLVENPPIPMDMGYKIYCRFHQIPLYTLVNHLTRQTRYQMHSSSFRKCQQAVRYEQDIWLT